MTNFTNFTRPPDATDLIKFYCYAVAIPAVAVPGLVGNLVSFFVLSRRNLRNSLNTYLAGQSLLDFVLLLSAFLLYFPLERCTAVPDDQKRQSNMCHFFWRSSLFIYPVSLVAQFASVWNCVLITADRYWVVKYPFTSRIRCTAKRAASSVCGVLLVAVVYRIPVFFELRLNEKGFVKMTALRENPIYHTAYHVIGYLFVLVLIPWTIMICLNAMVVYEVHHAKRNRAFLSAYITRANAPRVHRGGRQQRQEDRPLSATAFAFREYRSTVMAVAVVLCFLVCNVPIFVSHVIDSIYSFKKSQPAYNSDRYVVKKTIIFTGNVLVCINCVANLAIYFVFGRRYRQMCLQLVCRPFWTANRRFSVALRVDSAVFRRINLPPRHEARMRARKRTSTGPSQSYSHSPLLSELTALNGSRTIYRESLV